MRVRQSSGAVLESSDEALADTLKSLEDTFDRWDVKFTHLELGSEGACSDGDPLEREFLDREQEADLRRELQNLRAREDGQ